VDKLATISLYTTVQREDDRSNKDRVNIIQWLAVENMQFAKLSFLCGFRGASHSTGHCLLSTDQEMTLTMRQLSAHVQDFVVKGELLVCILKAFAYYTLREMLHVFSLCAVAEQSVVARNSRLQHRARHTHARGNHFAVCGLYMNLILHDEVVVYHSPVSVVLVTLQKGNAEQHKPKSSIKK
jgi:hypothetical protein